MEIGTKNHRKSEQPKTTVEIGRLHHLQTVGIGTARWSVLRGVASVVTDLRREPRRGSLLGVGSGRAGRVLGKSVVRP